MLGATICIFLSQPVKKLPHKTIKIPYVLRSLELCGWTKYQIGMKYLPNSERVL